MIPMRMNDPGEHQEILTFAAPTGNRIAFARLLCEMPITYYKDSIRISTDQRSFALVGRDIKQNNSFFVVHNGIRSKGYWYVRSQSLALSTDGKRIAYCITTKKGSGPRSFLVVDGQRVTSEVI